jgi:hypothetical protein
MVVVIWTALAALANYQRSELVEQLTQQISTGNVRGSLNAIRQLALTPHPLLEPIVAAATSTDRSLAGGAQLAISDLIDMWQQQLDIGRNVLLVADGIGELAAALDEYHGSFSAPDGSWITRTVGQLVRLANRVSPSDSLEFTTHCESLLATAGQGRSPSAALSAGPNTTIVAPNQVPSKPRSDSPLPTKNEADQVADITPLREFAASPAAESAFSAPPATAYQRLTATESAPAAPQVDHQTAVRPAPIDQSDAKAGWMLHSSGNVKGRSSQESLDAAASSAGAKKADFVPPAADELKAADSRSLLKQWLEASDGSRPPLERELARRSLGKLNAKLVQVLFSDRVEDRVRLVQEIVNSPGVNSKAWLSMLTDDPDADVRLAAVTFMATSTDPQLADQAYQAAIHDRDPRVADLAGRLRERRDNVQRR